MSEATTRTREIARENLSRETPFTMIRAEDGTEEPNDGFTLDGIGAVFDTITVVDSWEGRFEEVVQRGAFKRTLRETRPKMQFDHGRHPLIGSIPIGTFEKGYPAEEDDGLRVRGRLFDNWLIEPVRHAIADQAINGMSFRFSVVNDSWHSPEGRTKTNPGKRITDPEEILQGIYSPSDGGLLRRVLKEVKMPEVGPVVWPQYIETSVGVRSRVTIDLGNLNDPETRITLARAVFLVDQHDAGDNSSDVGPQSNGEAPDVHPAPAEQVDQTRDDGEAMGPNVSDEPSGELPNPETTPASSSLRDRIAAWEMGVTESVSTRTMIITEFPERAEP